MFEIIPNWHPIFVHFTVSTLSLASLFFVLSFVMRSHSQHLNIKMFAEWNLWIGSFFAILTATTGWLAYNSVAHDTPSHEAMTTHRNWALLTMAIFIALALWLFYKKRLARKVHISFVLAIIIAFGLLSITAWKGGEAVYRYGLGVMSLPTVDNGADGHAHEHGEDKAHTQTDTSMSLPMEMNGAANKSSQTNNRDDHSNHNH